MGIISPGVSPGKHKGKSRMSMCLCGVAMTKALSLRESERSEVGLYRYHCQSLFPRTRMHKTWTGTILVNTRLIFWMVPAPPWFLLVSKWLDDCSFSVMWILPRYPVRTRPKGLAYPAVWMRTAFFSFMSGMDRTVLTRCNVTFPLHWV